MFDVEDEVDWSDGTLNTPAPIPGPLPAAIIAGNLQKVSHPVEQSRDVPLQQPSPVKHRDAEDRDVSPSYLLNLFISGPRDATTRALTSTKKNPAMSIHLPLPKLSQPHLDITKLDKKTYDAAFLKRYIAQALAPHTLDLKKRFPGVTADALLQHERYLRTVRDHVYTIVDGIFWKVNPAAPSVEKPDQVLRVEKPLAVSSAKKQADVWRPNNYGGITITKRASKAVARIPRPTHPRAKRGYRGRDGSGQGSIDTPADAPTLLEALVVQSGSDTVMGTMSSSDDVSRLEQLVAQSGSDILMGESFVPREEPVRQLRGTSHDRAAARRLIDDHLKRVARRFGFSVEDVDSQEHVPKPQDIEITVRIAVDNGIVRPPSPRTQEKIAERARRQREEWAAAERAEHERLEQADRTVQEQMSRFGHGAAAVHADQGYPGYVAAAGSTTVKPSPTAQKKQKLSAKPLGTTAKPKVASGTPGTKRSYRKKNADYWSTKSATSSAVKGPGTRIDPHVAEAQSKRAASPLAEQGRKRQRTTVPITPQSSKKNAKPKDNQPLPPHPSGSKTLEPHQALPPDAYFSKKHIDDKPAWRCHVQHALGNYYNSGDRKSCRGCNTNVSALPHKTMDFYMLPNTVFYQPTAPDARPWLPHAPTNNPKKHKSHSHNSIAKDAFWEAKNGGASDEDARETAVAHLVEYLRPKPKPEPASEPTPEPEPEPIDLGPHPSGSTTMEHGQEIPSCYYFTPASPDEQLAWRCDGAHAFGRYYMAGDKRCCPGCGLSKTGAGRRQEMDFYMPAGAAIRQEAANQLMEWKPRRPNKVKGRKEGKKRTVFSHNQMVAGEYWRLVDGGVGEGEALVGARERVDEMLDARYAGEDEDEDSGRDKGSGVEGKEVKKKEKKKEKKKKGGGRKKVVKSDECVREESEDAQVGVLMGPGNEEGERVHPVAQKISPGQAGGRIGEVIDISSAEENSSSGSDSE